MILLTGGTGYVGSRMVEKLRERGTPVRLQLRTSENPYARRHARANR